MRQEHSAEVVEIDDQPLVSFVFYPGLETGQGCNSVMFRGPRSPEKHIVHRGSFGRSPPVTVVDVELNVESDDSTGVLSSMVLS
eukprot:619850-Prorocentrum_minimum.AAC.1